MQTRKIGISLNPILRLGQHKYKNYIKSSNNIIRVIECYDYLKCEAEIKKLTNGKEVFEWNKELSLKVKKIMDKYVCTELDPTTIEILVNSPSLKKYFDKK